MGPIYYRVVYGVDVLRSLGCLIQKILFFGKVVTLKLFLKIENLSDEVRRSSGQLISREYTRAISHLFA